MSFLLKLREESGKWLMRVQQAGRVLRLPLFFITAVSTMVTALKGTFLSDYTLLIVGVFCAGSAVFVWAYDRFKVMNVQNRWNADRSDNYVGPTTAVNQMVNARQLAVLAEGLNSDKNQEQVVSNMREATLEELRRYRNGFDLGDIDG